MKNKTLMTSLVTAGILAFGAQAHAQLLGGGVAGGGLGAGRLGTGSLGTGSIGGAVGGSVTGEGSIARPTLPDVSGPVNRAERVSRRAARAARDRVGQTRDAATATAAEAATTATGVAGTAAATAAGQVDAAAAAANGAVATGNAATSNVNAAANGAGSASGMLSQDDASGALTGGFAGEASGNADASLLPPATDAGSMEALPLAERSSDEPAKEPVASAAPLAPTTQPAATEPSRPAFQGGVSASASASADADASASR